MDSINKSCYVFKEYNTQLFHKNLRVIYNQNSPSYLSQFITQFDETMLKILDLFWLEVSDTDLQ
jgi:hypothetical protein